VAAQRAALVRVVVEGMRPRQWTKNAFVLGGLVFSGETTDPASVWRALAVTLAFCLASGAAYLINDVLDVELDRRQARTAGRPVARGALTVRAALVGAAVAGLLGLALAAVVNLTSLGVLAGFLALQVAYSTVLKHLLLLDVMAIAGGFVLRGLGGLVAIDVAISPWLLLCTALLALFLGLVKRRGEAVRLGGTAEPQRPVLEHYSVALLDEYIAAVSPTTIVVYALYAVTGARTDAMLLTLPFVMYGILRVLYLIHHRTTVTDDPSVLVWRDRELLICVALWAVVAGVISVLSPA